MRFTWQYPSWFSRNKAETVHSFIVFNVYIVCTRGYIEHLCGNCVWFNAIFMMKLFITIIINPKCTGNQVDEWDYLRVSFCSHFPAFSFLLLTHIFITTHKISIFAFNFICSLQSSINLGVFWKFNLRLFERMAFHLKKITLPNFGK